MDLPLRQKEPSNAARSRNSDPPNGDHLFSFLREPLPTIPTSSHPQPTSSSPPNDLKSALHRRFTTNTYVSPIGQARPQAAEPPVPGISSIFQPRTAPSEKKKAEYEYLRQKQQQRQSKMYQLNKENRREEQELYRLRQELGFGGSVGHQSEPTTPPEIRDSGFPSALSKPNRFSASTLTSPTGMLGRKTPGDSSHLNSPPNERARAYNALTSAAPDTSTPQSRHESDGEEERDETFDVSHRSAASLNRHSMPGPRRDLQGQDNTPEWDPSLGHVDTAAFLWGRESGQMAPSEASSQSTARPKPAYQFHEVDDFPVLSQQKDGSANKGTMMHQTASPTDGGNIEKESPTHQDSRAIYRRSFPAHGGSGYNVTGDTDSRVGSSTPSTKANHTINRHSTGLSMGFQHQDSHLGEASTSTYGSVIPSTPGSESSDLPPKLQTSYSTNDIPTMRTNDPNGKAKETNGTSAYQTPQTSTAEQRLHNHNASLGRIPPGAINTTRHGRDFSGGIERNEEPKSDVGSVGTVPTPRASYQSPTGNNQVIESPNGNTSATSPMSPYGTNNSVLGNFGYPPSLATSLNHLAINNPNGWNGTAMQTFGSPYEGNYSTYPGYGSGYQRFSDSQQRVVQERRQRDSQDSTSQTQFNQPLEAYREQIINMCKDQHGCRFLQKKIEEGKAAHLNLIFNEIKDSISELMVDPFANYLVQKLLDFATVDQRTALIYKAAPDMLSIGLNQHGTRALQKMIDHITSDKQIQHLTVALRGDVVRLIQDLNGNHVVQKCLNKLKPLEVQFIMDAVAESIMIVGRHRHGCCVIQRCIDHANANQKNQLVSSITEESIPLVRDAYGNYVIQYVFDQADDAVNTSLARTFLGRIASLSKEKFSSNVMEKAIRIANPQVKHEIVEEILQEPEFDKFVDHPFGNYVVQTALEYANADDEQRLVDQIRPILHLLKNKPHGRRYSQRISERDKRMNFPSSNGQMTPQHRGGSVQPTAHPYGGGFNMTGQPDPTTMFPTHTPIPQNGGLNINSMGSPSFGHPQFAGPNQSPAHHQFRSNNFQFPGNAPMGGQGMPPMNGLNHQYWAQFYNGGRGY